MGTKVQYKSYLPGYYSMKDLNDNSNICSWPLFYGDKSITNGQYYNGFFPTPTSETYLGDEKDAVKLTMLEHEAIFKNQVYELHRLYRIQRDMMDEIKRKEFHPSQIQGDVALSTNLLPCQVASDDVRRLHFTSFPLANSSTNRPSISGAEEIHSSLSSMKGNNRQVGPFPSPEENSLKEFDRPTKVRRKVFDLQLPADEYIDSEEGEETHDEIAPAIYFPNKNGKIGSNDKASSSFSWKSNGLGDLNEPIKIEETNSSAYADLIGHTSFHGETQVSCLSSKPLSQLLGLPTEISLHSSNGSNTALQNNHNVDKSINGRGKFSIVLEEGNCKDNEKSKLPASSKPNQGFLHLTEERKGGAEKNHEISFHGGFATSHFTNSYHASPNFNLNKSWEKQIGIFCQTSEPVQTRPNFDFDPSVSLHKSSHSLARSNGFFRGSSSGLKDGTVHSSSICYEHPKFNSKNSRVPEKIREASSYFDMNSSDGINLNVVHTNNSSNRGVHQSGFTIKDVKSQDENHQSTIPWLRAFPSSKKEAANGEMSIVQSSVRKLYDKTENGDESKKVLPQVMKFGSCSNEVVEGRSEPGSKKLLGFLIFEESRIAKTDTFSPTSLSATNPHPPPESKMEDSRKMRSLDINLPCDPFISDTEAVQNQTVSGLRNQIDLNLSVSDEEEVFEIDLEAPAVPESIENVIDAEEVENLGDELTKMAAEAIVSISCKNTIEDEEDNSRRGTLPWFVDIALNIESTSELSDDFETMTLRLKETSVEEYMPKPLFPDTIKFEEPGNFTQTRPRKGQSRRGRQRRDFQRDILPGLTTLSRHEVTEDLQTFGGLMRATGHSWHSGVARRNSGRNIGGGRGRRRAVISPTPLQNTTPACHVELGLEDRSLTGWGKTTRRPRRQRIPAGNIPVVPLS